MGARGPRWIRPPYIPPTYIHAYARPYLCVRHRQRLGPHVGRVRAHVGDEALLIQLLVLVCCLWGFGLLFVKFCLCMRWFGGKGETRDG